MKSGTFVVLVLVSGALAGLVHGGVNLVLVEPFIDEAAYLESRNLDSGREPALLGQYDSFREWQKGGQVLASVILGVSMGSLFGIVYGLSRRSLPGRHDVTRAAVLAGIMWCVLFLVPFLKYPGELPAGTGADTVAYRGVLFLAFVAISGFSALGFYRLSKKLCGMKKAASVAGYGALMVAAGIMMPGYSDADAAGIMMPGYSDADAAGQLAEFRAASVIAVSAFWASDALILGLLWSRFGRDGPPRRPYG